MVEMAQESKESIGDLCLVKNMYTKKKIPKRFHSKQFTVP